MTGEEMFCIKISKLQESAANTDYLKQRGKCDTVINVSNKERVTHEPKKKVLHDSQDLYSVHLIAARAVRARVCASS